MDLPSLFSLVAAMNLSSFFHAAVVDRKVCFDTEDGRIINNIKMRKKLPSGLSKNTISQREVNASVRVLMLHTTTVILKCGKNAP